MKNTIVKNANKLIKALPDEPVIDFTEVEIDGALSERLAQGDVTTEWLKDNAPWNQWIGEGHDEFSWFRHYTQLPIDVWKAHESWEESGLNNDVSFELWQEAFTTFEWVKRRMAFTKYQEWVQRKRDELQQLQHIAEFRNSQALLMHEASEAGILLVEKLRKRLETLEPDEIKPHNIPAFIGSLGTFLNMASDAEARLLAITDLLEHYESNIAEADLREQLFLINEGEVT